MSPEEELRVLRRIAELEGVDTRPVGADVQDAGITGAKRGLSAVVGLPGDAINFATQTLPKATKFLGLPEGAPLGPRMPAGSAEALNILDQVAPTQPTQTRPGRFMEAGTAGFFGGGGPLGAVAGLAGQGVKELAQNDDGTVPSGAEAIASIIAALPFGAKGLWSALRPRRAEHTAQDMMRNVGKDDLRAIELQNELFSKYAPGGRVLPGQGLPEHTGAANLSNTLMAGSEGKPLVDALILQQQKRKAMEGPFRAERDSLYAFGDAVKPTRAASRVLEADARNLPKSLAIAPGSQSMRQADKDLDELARVLASRPTARELSVQGDALASRADVVPGMGPWYPALAGKVKDVARRTAPKLKEADELAAQKKALDAAMDRVGLPTVTSIAGGKDIAPSIAVPLAAGAQLAGHPLMATGLLSKAVRAIVTGNPKEKLAEALADPSMKKLQALNNSRVYKEVPPDVLRAAIQAELQQTGE